MIKLSRKDALGIILSEICCANGKEFCNDKHCPLSGTNCVAIDGTDKEVLFEGTRILKELYDEL